MYYLATTRFNTYTLEQNIKWRDKNNWTGCIYGIPMKMSETIPYGSTVFILEMNNDINKIVGIGLIKNNVYQDKHYKIYKWGNYNRYVYKSKYRIDRNSITEKEEKIINILDILLFKGSRHLKRGQGITSIPKWISENKHFDFKKYIYNMFVNRYKVSKINYV
jgi:hypothetical protein